MPKRHNSSNTPPHLTFIKGMVVALSRYARDTKTNLTGTMACEKKDDDPIIFMFSSFKGDTVLWFNDAGKAHLYTLVNEKVKHINSVLATEIPALQLEATRLGRIFAKNNP